LPDDGWHRRLTPLMTDERASHTVRLYTSTARRLSSHHDVAVSSSHSTAPTPTPTPTPSRPTRLYILTSDTRYFLARMSVSVSVSASWNWSLSSRRRRMAAIDDTIYAIARKCAEIFGPRLDFVTRCTLCSLLPAGIYATKRQPPKTLHNTAKDFLARLDSQASENYRVGGVIVRRCLRDSTFRSFDTIPACDRHTHTHTHDDSIYTVLA